MNLPPDLPARIRNAFEAFIVSGIPAPAKLREAVVNYLVTGVAVAPWGLHEFPDVTPVARAVFWVLWYLHNKFPESNVECEIRYITRELRGIPPHES